MLDLMLGNSDDAASCGEVGAWYRPKREDRVAIQCPCGIDPCPRWTPILDVPRSRFHREAFDRWGVRYLSDSTKTLGWILDSNRWAHDAGIRVVNVLIWKDPATHAYSHWKRGTSFEDARRRFVRYYSRFLKMGLPFVSVNYDELARSPGQLLPEVCRVIGMPYHPGREHFWARRHHNLFGNAGTGSQVGRDSGRVRPSENFPAEFRQALAAHEDRIGIDPRPVGLVAALRRFDVKEMEAETFERPAERPSRMVGYWYFEERYKHVFRTALGRLRPARLSGLAGG